jgi:nitric oxide reductase subunit C
VRWKPGALALILVLTATACGGEEATSGTGPKDGETLFAQTTLGNRQGCPACHSLTERTIVIGPSLAGIGARAAERVPGLSATDYLRQSILDPSAHVVDGYQPGEMPGGWDEVLSDDQVDALVDYLAGLR